MKGFREAFPFRLFLTSFILCLYQGEAAVQTKLRSDNLSASGCNKDISIANGFPTFVNNDDVVLFECYLGFLPYGGMKASCKNQKWDAEPPKCIKKGCSQLKIPINGHFEEEFSGALVKFQCDSGYKIVGDSVITCDGKDWSHEPPTCSKLPRKVVEQNASQSISEAEKKLDAEL